MRLVDQAEDIYLAIDCSEVPEVIVYEGIAYVLENNSLAMPTYFAKRTFVFGEEE